MFYIVLTTDKPNSTEVRASNRPAHLEYLESFGEKLVAGGATLSDDGESPTGSFLLVDMENRDAVEDFARNDPFAKAGLFETTEIRRWRKVYFHPPQD